MGWIAYIDESGDHGLTKIDPASPYFALSAAVYDRDDYMAKEIPSFGRLKVAYWGHEGVIFHAYDIKKRVGPFSFCKHKSAEDSFREDLCALFRRSSAKIICAVIDKQKHCQQYVTPSNPYFLAVQFVLERIAMMSGGRALIIFESRGKAEDRIVEGWCARVAGGENYKAQTFQFTVKFARKRDNVAGLQLADLSCQPIIHHVQNPDSDRPDWLAVKARIRSDWLGRIEGRGLKVFP
jgi:hypothetical protein